MKKWAAFPHPFIILILLLSQKELLARPSVFDPLLYFPFLTAFMLVYAVSLFYSGRIPGYTLPSVPFCKGRSTTSLNSHLSFDLLSRYQTHGCFAGLQFDFAKCFDSIPYKIIWTALRHFGCDSALVDLLSHLYSNISRCFRYAGCLGSFWFATNGLLQGDPLSVVILNCVPLSTNYSFVFLHRPYGVRFCWWPYCCFQFLGYSLTCLWLAYSV